VAGVGVGHVESLVAYEAALAQHRWEAIEPFIHDDACFIFSEGTHHGKPAIEIAIRATFQKIADEVYRISDVRWIHVTAGAALCTYAFNWSGLIGGVAATGRGRGTSLLVSSPDGWKIKLEHLGP
jgi:hypothetical protein